MQTANPQFEQIKEKIINLVTEEYQRNQLELANMMALFFILGQARNQDELLRLTRIFSDKFPVLNEFLMQEKSAAQEKSEKELEQILQKMVKDDPTKAAEIAKKSIEQDMTLDKLLELYPELQKYKNQ